MSYVDCLIWRGNVLYQSYKKQKCGPVGLSLEEGHGNAQRTGASLLWRKAGRARTVLPGDEKAQEGTYQCVQTPEGRVQKTEPGSFWWGPVTGPKAMGTNWNRRFPLSIRKHFFTVSEGHQSLVQLAQTGCQNHVCGWLNLASKYIQAHQYKCQFN